MHNMIGISAPLNFFPSQDSIPFLPKFGRDRRRKKEATQPIYLATYPAIYLLYVSNSIDVSFYPCF